MNCLNLDEEVVLAKAVILVGPLNTTTFILLVLATDKKKSM